MGLEFHVLGNPAPQGSKVSVPPKLKHSKPGLFEASPRLGLWRMDIQNAAREAIREKIAYAIPPTTSPWFPDGPLVLDVDFRMRRPKKPKHECHITEPDLGKLLRAVEDALQHIVYANDSQIVSYGKSLKRYAEANEVPGATINIWRFGWTT